MISNVLADLLSTCLLVADVLDYADGVANVKKYPTGRQYSKKIYSPQLITKLQLL